MKKKEYILYYDMTFINLFSIIILFLMVGLTILIDNLLGANIIGQIKSNFIGETTFGYFLFLLLFPFWFWLHELIHYVAYCALGANKDNIVFGVRLEKGVFYCKCKEYIQRKCIMGSLISPFLFIGIVTYIIGFIINSWVLVLLSVINISGASADILMFFFFLKQNDDIEFKEMGFSSPFCLRTSDNLENKKFLGIKSIKLVEDKSETFEEEEKKIYISKTSWVFLIVYMLFLGLLFVNFVIQDKYINNFQIGEKSDILITEKDVSMTVKEGTLSNIGVTLVLENDSDKLLRYDEYYKMEIKKDNEWHTINVELYFNDPLWGVKQNSTEKIELNWEHGYGKLAPGEYRIIKEVYFETDNSMEEPFYVSAEFTIE